MNKPNGKLRILYPDSRGDRREQALLVLREALADVEANPHLDSVYIITRSSEGKTVSELRWGGVGSDVEMLGVLDIAQSEHRNYLRQTL